MNLASATPMTTRGLETVNLTRSSGPSAPVAPREAEAQDVPETAERAGGNVRQMPLKWGGKLFFSKPDGDYQCSAQFISDNVILTAAHCVRDEETGKTYSDFRFELQYRNGQSAQSYGWSCLGTKRGWVQPSDDRYRFDYAMLRVDAENPVGNFGWHLGWRGRFQTAMKVGYPAQLEGGETVQVQPGELFFPESIPGVVGLRHGNVNHTEGSSGGAWIARFNPNTTDKSNYVVSVSSFHLKNDPGTAYGPYWDDGFTTLLVEVSNGCR